MLQELSKSIIQNTWFSSLGILLAYVLMILQIYDFLKKRVSLKIKLEQDDFSSYRINHPGTYQDKTIIDINIDLRNMGLEPTTLVGVDFYSDNELLNNLKMFTRQENYDGMIISNKFDEIRIEHNDRKTFTIHASEAVLLPNDIKELNAKLIFKIAHKDISKKIKLIRKN